MAHKRVKSKLKLLIVGLSFLSMPISSLAEWGDIDLLSQFGAGSVAKACGSGASGNFSIFAGGYKDNCDLVGMFDQVQCFGNGSGRINSTTVVRLTQTDCDFVYPWDF